MSKNIQKLKNRELPKGLITGAFSLTLSTIIVKILGLIYKIPISAMLGDEGMGYFNSAYTVYAFFYLLCTAGVPKAVMLLISEAKAKGKFTDEKRVLSVALLLFVALGLIITAMFILFAGQLATLIGNSESRATMIAIAPSIIFISIAGVFRGYLTAEMKLMDIAVSQIIEGVGKLVLGLFLAMLGSRLSLPLGVISALTILGVSFGALFGLVYLLVCSKARIFNKNAGQNCIDGQFITTARRIFSISLPITVSAAIMSLTGIIDLGLIMRSLKEIGYSESQSSALYGNYTTLAVPMFNLALAIITPISVSFLPAITSSLTKGEGEKLYETIKSSHEITAFLAAPMTLGLMTFPREILDLLFKNSRTDIGAVLLFILAPSILFASILINVNNFLEASGKTVAPIVSVSVGSLAKIIVSYLLITRSPLGVLGAPIGTVVSYAVALLISLLINVLTVKQKIPIFSAYFTPCLIAVTSVIFARYVFENTDKSNLYLIASIAIAGGIYLGLSALLYAFKGGKIGKLALLPKMSSKNYPIRRKIKI